MMAAKKQPKTNVYRALQAGAGMARGEVFESDGSHPLVLAGLAVAEDAPPAPTPPVEVDAAVNNSPSDAGSDADSSKS